MGRVWQLDSNFTRGELDPRLVGRKDIAAYYAGAQTAKNVMPLVQGGLRRRNGTEFLYESGEGRIFNFSYSTEVNYCLLFTDLNIAVFKDGVWQVDVVSPYTLAQVQDLDYIQSADTALLFQSGVAPRRLSRTSDILWTLSTIVFLNVPQYDFNDTLSPVPTSAVQRVTFVNYWEGDRYKISLEGALSDEVVWAGNNATNEDNIRTALENLFNTAGSGTITVAAFAVNVFDVTFSAGSARPWQLMSFTPIITSNVAFAGNVTLTTPGVARSESVWSVARGWPKVATFHESRLWLGGTLYRPATVWGSKVSDFFDFNKGKARDDEGIDVTLDTDQVNAITGIFSNRNLQVFTSGGEFSIPTSPITPENVSIAPQTSFGSKKVRPISIDGLTLFIQRTGKSVRNFFYVNEANAYSSSSVSVLASHLIYDPIEMAASKGSSSVDANYAYFVNADGTMAVYNSLASEDVQGFTQWVTEGSQISIAVVDNLLYTYTMRTVGGVDTYFLEREDTTLTTDSSASSSSTDTLTGLTHLEGETIDVIADGSFMGEFVVTGGQVTINRQALLITGGLNFVPLIETMPLNTGLSNGPNAALPKRVVSVGLELFESNGVLVNGQRIADKTMGTNVFDPPIPNTGLERMYLQGWNVSAVVSITQVEPMPMTILALYVEISV